MREIVRALSGGRHPRQHLRRSRSGRSASGPPRSAAIASSSTPSRSRARFTQGDGAVRASSSMPAWPPLAHELGLGVNAGHDLDLTTSRCSATCRISTKPRSATRSSAMRSTSASIARCATTSRRSVGSGLVDCQLECRLPQVGSSESGTAWLRGCQPAGCAGARAGPPADSQPRRRRPARHVPDRRRRDAGGDVVRAVDPSRRRR